MSKEDKVLNPVKVTNQYWLGTFVVIRDSRYYNDIHKSYARGDRIIHNYKDTGGFRVCLRIK